MTKTNNKMKTTKRGTWMTMTLIGAISVGIVSCSDDDSTDITPDEAEAESAWLIGVSQDTPTGSVLYMSVHEEMPKDVDVSSAVELGVNTSVSSYGEDVFTVNDNAGTITKWEVNKRTLELSPSALLSVASAGFTGGLPAPLFISETQAFSIDIQEGAAVEWNPETMKVIETINFPPNPLASIDPDAWSVAGEFQVINGKILMPIRYGKTDNCCEFTDGGGAMVGVFDPLTNSVVYNQDPRSVAGHAVLKNDGSGNLYFPPSIYNTTIAEYFNHDNQPFHTILKVNADGSFDPDFELKLDEILPLKITREVTYISGNNLVLVYIDTDYETPGWENRFDFFSAQTHKVSIDLTTKEVQPFTGFDGYNSVNSFVIIDEKQYMHGFNQIDGKWYDTILRENSFGDYSEVSTVSNGFFGAFSRLW